MDELQRQATRDAPQVATTSARRRGPLRWTSSLLVVAVVVLVAASVVDLDQLTSSSLHHHPELGVSFAVPEGWDAVDGGLEFASPDGEATLFVSRYVHRDASDFVAASRWNLHWYDALPRGWRLVTDDETVVDGRVGWWTVAEGPAPDARSPHRTASLQLDVGDGTAVAVDVWQFATERHDAEELLASVIDSLEIGDVALPESHRLTVADDGIAGEYWVPDDAGEPGPAILYFGGSDGGFIRLDPSQLGRAGLPTLSLAYWAGRDVFQDLPGLPTALEEVPLEYFASAIHWLADRPEVDPDRIYLWGTSRGGEAALLLGATYPELVHGVIANAPSNVVGPSYPFGGGPTRSGWSLGGEPVPMVTPADESPTGAPTPREIPIEDFDGPILLTCGELDDTWPACPMSRRVIERLEEHDYPHRVELAAYADIGHYLNFSTGSLAADPRDGDDAWQRTLAFIDETS